MSGKRDRNPFYYRCSKLMRYIKIALYHFIPFFLRPGYRSGSIPGILGMPGSILHLTENMPSTKAWRY